MMHVIRTISGWICAQLFALCRLGHVIIGLVAACLLSTEFMLMVCVLLIAWLAGHPGLHLTHFDNGGWMTGSLSRMFDLGTILGILGSEEYKWYQRIVPVLQYLGTWLMGGGILIGVVIGRGGQYLKRVREGRCRFRSFLKNHYVVLGWEPNSVALLRELTHGKGRVCRFWPFSRAWWARPRIVILASDVAMDVNRQLRMAYGIDSSVKTFWFKLPFSRVIYSGDYDDANEFKRLNIARAKKVFVTGELDEEGHDCRVLMAVSGINEFAQGMSKSRLPVKVRIASPILHHQLKNRSLLCENLDLELFNFHVNWARNLWCDDGRARIANDPGLDLVPRNHADDEKPRRVTVVVVGLGRMGLAIIERIMEMSPTLAQAVDILVVDPNGKQRREQLESSYQEDFLTCKNRCTFDYVEKEAESPEFLDKFEELVSSKRPIIVAVTLARPDKALERAFDIERLARDLSGKNVRILLRQNVDVVDDKACTLIPIRSYKMKNLYLFGFQNGAGFGVGENEGAKNAER